MKVVVTGATGHIGCYTVHALSRAQHEVVAVSRSGSLPALPFGEAERGGNVRALKLDLRSDSAVAALAAELDGDVALVHLGAWHPPATAATTSADRRELVEVNVYGTLRALDAARRSRRGVACVVYASSFEVYGDVAGFAPITEDTRRTPLTDYGATKLAGEDHLLAFAFEEKVRVIALRMPAVYGPAERTPRALPNFLRQVQRGERPSIHGDGQDLRDQLHVRDAAQAIERALAAQVSGIFNIADGEPHSVLELARFALELSGLGGEPSFLPRQKPRHDYHMCIAKARSELGFVPRVALRDGMAEELREFRQAPPS